MTEQILGAETGVATSTAQRKGRRWISKRLAELDPEVDYVEIVRLSTLYNVNDLQLGWFYSVGTPAAGIAPDVIDAVYRNGTGKYVNDGLKRRDDSVDHMFLWLEHGPDSPATAKSIDMINKYHAHYSKTFPDGFAKAEDYIYILCLNATLVHTAMRSLGLPGFDAKQQRAMQIAWSKIADQFTAVLVDESVTKIDAFPDTFEAMIAYVDDYVARPWPVHQAGHESTKAVIEQFATAFFPKPLHFVGRALVTSFLFPEVLRAHDIKAPSRVLRWMVRSAMKSQILMATHVLADPKESVLDRRRLLTPAATKKTTNTVDVAVHRAIAGTRAPASMCPHLALQDAAAGGPARSAS